ncbi:MAG: putative sulfate exporter family transporter [Pseudomonadota bacterium]
MAVNVILGISLALCLAFAGQCPVEFFTLTLMGLLKSPGIAIMLVILLGILVSNTVKLPDIVQPCIRFSLVRVLRFGIVLLGIRHSFAEVGAISLKTLPIIVGAMVTALIVLTCIVNGMGLAGRLGVLLAGE